MLGARAVVPQIKEENRSACESHEVVSGDAATTDNRKVEPIREDGQANFHHNEPTAATATAKL